MAITRQVSRRTLILQPTNAEVSTNQVYAARYEFLVDGELALSVPRVINSMKHTDAAFSIHRVDVSVNKGGTSTYLVQVVSYDVSGLNPITHVSETVTITGDRQRISIAVADAAVPENRSLECTVSELVPGVAAFDMTVTVIAEDFADIRPERLGHRILDEDNVVQPQQPDLKFGANLVVTDEPGSSRTVVTADTGFIGQMLQSMLTEPQMQALYGTNWILADGRSVIGSTYASITGATNAPDARGLFLRGKNNGRLDGNEDSAGERALGAYQADDLQEHRHWTASFNNTNNENSVTGVGNLNSIATTGGTSGSSNVERYELRFNAREADTLQTSNTGGLETQPKNLAVNTFIKID